MERHDGRSRKVASMPSEATQALTPLKVSDLWYRGSAVSTVSAGNRSDPQRTTRFSRGIVNTGIAIR